MTDHDQRFKALLKEFFADFFSLFRSEWAEGLDFSRIEWLDKEIFPDSLRGHRREVDLLARVAAVKPLEGVPAGKPQLALLHAEIESADSVESLRKRMYDYYKYLRDVHDMPVLPIALYLRVGKGGTGWETYTETVWQRELLRFEFPYVGLPGLSPEEFRSQANLLGVALSVLMNVPAEAEAFHKAEALRRILESDEPQRRKLMLADFVQAYLPLGGTQQEVFDLLVRKEPYMSVLRVGKTWFEEGEEHGELNGIRRIARKLLEKRFGLLPESAAQRLEQLSAEQLEQLAVAIPEAATLAELGLAEPPTT